MAIVPPDYNKGDFNTDTYAPVTWTEVQPTNNQIIDRNDMPFSSTVEYKGYYKAEATGFHTFSLTGSTSITGYSWVSSAPRNSDHIQIPGGEKARTIVNKSYGVIIPLKREDYWPWEDTNVLGPGSTFPGYGYWPRSNYGNSTGWNAIYSGVDTPKTECGYDNSNPLRVAHQTFLPGDIRQYNTNYPQFVGDRGGPAWQGPEDPNFEAPCYTSGSFTRPLIRIPNATGNPFDSGTVPTTQGKTSQVYLDPSFKAEGRADDAWAQYEVVKREGDHTYIWPKSVNVYTTGNGKRSPERVFIRFGITLLDDQQDYTFEFKTRDALKIWYLTGSNDARNTRKFEPDTGINPCNKFSNNAAETGWEPGGGLDGFTGKINMPRGVLLQFIGHAAGVPANDTHGWSLVVRNNAGEIVWTTEQLLTSVGSELIGIDECGYHALLDPDTGERTSEFRNSEFYKNDGWGGYKTGALFLHDDRAGDSTERDISTTRQYLWSNSTTKLRGGTSIPGTVYLRQGDFYFVRTIVSNSKNEVANFRFSVSSPSGINQSVKFSGNGDPNTDTNVGGSAGGNGIPIQPEALCNSVLYAGSTAAPNDTNFAFIESLSVVLNLNVLGVRDFEIGREGQAESIGGNVNPNTESKIISFDDGPGDSPVDITITQLVRGGTGDIPALNQEQRDAVYATNDAQLEQNQTIEFNTFRSAITSQAVIQWGLGGNYPYIYHAVSEVITSICTDVPINPPVAAQTAGNAGSRSNTSSSRNSQTQPTCIDVNYNVLTSAEVQITSDCFDECPPDPTQYPNLTKFPVNQSDYDSLGFVSGWKDRIDPKPGFHAVGTGVIITREPGDTIKIPGYEGYKPVWYNRMSSRNESQASVLCGPGRILSIPWTVSDIYYPDDWELTVDKPAEIRVSGPRIEWSSNTFFYDPNNAGRTADHDWNDTFQKGIIIFWVSAIAGGPRSGNYSSMGTPAWSTTPKIFVTYSYDVYRQAIEPNSEFRDNFVAYAGNTAGPRWMNFVVLNQAKLKARPQTNPNFNKWNLPEPGTQEFVDMFEVYGYKTNEFRMYDYRPVPDCSGGYSNSNSNNNNMKSLKNMEPYIGDSWDGTVPSHVTMATNGGYTWSSTPESEMTPYPAGIGPGNSSPRLTGNAIYFTQPLNGKILSYEWAATNEKICISASYVWVYSPSGGQAVLNSCSPQLTVVRWFSATPGGRPLLNVNGDRIIYNIGDAAIDPRFDIQQLYDVNDSKDNSAYTIPVITKKYFLNAACIESSDLATIQAEERAPTPSELRVFDPKACGSDVSFAYVVSGPKGDVENFEQWLTERNA